MARQGQQIVFRVVKLIPISGRISMQRLGHFVAAGVRIAEECLVLRRPELTLPRVVPALLAARHSRGRAR